MRSLIEKIMPLVIFIIMIMLFIAGVIVFSYLLIFAAIVGLVLVLIAWVREKFFSQHKKFHTKTPKKGRIIEHDDKS